MHQFCDKIRLTCFSVALHGAGIMCIITEGSSPVELTVEFTAHRRKDLIEDLL